MFWLNLHVHIFIIFNLKKEQVQVSIDAILDDFLIFLWIWNDLLRVVFLNLNKKLNACEQIGVQPILFAQTILIQTFWSKLFRPTSDTTDDIYVPMF